MNQTIRIGVDTSKSVFVLHGVDAAEQCVACAGSCGAARFLIF